MSDNPDASASSVQDVDTLKLRDDLARRLTDFVAAESFFRDPRLQKAAEVVWRGDGGTQPGGLLGDLWVEGAFPPATMVSLSEAADQGWMSADLIEHLNSPPTIPGDTPAAGSEPRFPARRPLYRHQAEAIRVAAASPDSPPAVLVTAGTGWGKTEAFLFPALNRLWTRPRRGRGMRCLVIYPLNALVRDQIDRLSTWLSGQNRLRFFQFNSETPEDARAARREGLDPRPGPRVWTRKDAREAPCPDICVTNYSMLEYMLARPQDEVFFDDALDVVILDEVHLYTGSLATEITYLLRRTLLRCGRDPGDVLFLAASATLGSDTQALRQFISDLTDKPLGSTHVITSDLAPLPPLPATPLVDIAPRDVLEILRRVATEPAAGADLYRTVASWQPMETVRRTLHRAADRGESLTLDQLAEECWGSQEQQGRDAVAALLRLGAIAQGAPGRPHVPHRLHMVVRGGPALSLCAHEGCDAPPEAKVPGYGAVQEHQGERCRWCGALAFPISRCRDCGHAFIRARSVLGRIEPALPARLPESHSTLRDEFTLLCLDPMGSPMTFDPQSGALGGDARFWQVDEATGCEHNSIVGAETGPGLVFNVLAETLLAAMPPEPPRKDGSPLPAGGRRLLAFSDSRREAARLGPVLTRQHEVQLVRAWLLELMAGDEGADVDAVAYWTAEVGRLRAQANAQESEQPSRLIVQELSRARRQLAAAESGLTIRQWVDRLAESGLPEQLLDLRAGKQHRAASWSIDEWRANRRANAERLSAIVGREFLSPLAPFRFRSLETLGLIRVEYPGLKSVELPADIEAWLDVEAASRLNEQWPEALACLLDSLRQDGAVTLGDDDSDREFEERARPIGRWCVFDDAGGSSRQVAFVGTPAHRHNRFAAGLMGVDAAADGQTAGRLLRVAFDCLYALADSVDWLKRESSPRAIQVQVAALVLGNVLDNDPLWLDDAGHLSHRAIDGRHFVNTVGSVRRVGSDELDRESHFGRIRSELVKESSLKSALWAEEHSAHLRAGEARRIQELFTEGARNVLSSSTTLELGVDIGGLSGVMLTNVPPNVARYRQRAGRAGRRGLSASIAVTYARNRPFDSEVFRRTQDFLGLPARLPRVLLDRNQIALRHAYALLLGEYFRVVRPAGTVTGTMNVYTRMGSFVGVPHSRYWGRGASPSFESPLDPDVNPSVHDEPWWIAGGYRPHADRFVDYLEWLRAQSGRRDARLVTRLLERSQAAPSSSGWPGFVEEALDRFRNAVRRFRNLYHPYVDAWNEARDEGDRGKASCNYLHRQLVDLYETNVVEFLARYQFLPKYGFPVDVLTLKVFRGRDDPGRSERVAFQRSGALALREYVPGSRVVAAGEEIHSRGLNKSWVRPTLEDAVGGRRRLAQCASGHMYSAPAIGAAVRSCRWCDSPAEGVPLDLLEVRRGFATAAWERPRRARAGELIGEIDKAPPGDLAERRIGSGNEADQSDYARVPGLGWGFHPGISIYTYHRGEHSHGFAICLHCGYAESETKPGGEGLVDPPPRFADHRALWLERPRGPCPGLGRAQVARHHALSVEDVTDGLLVRIADLVPSVWADDPGIRAISLAAPHAAGTVLSVEANEIEAMVYPTGDGAALFVYDAVSGGAGHAEALASNTYARPWLEAIRDRLWVDDDHDARCERGCMSCIVSFEGQYRFASTPVDRRRGLLIVDRVLGNGPAPPPVSGNRPSHAEPDLGSTGGRIARAGERLRRRNRRA